jgi:hypothetical protein
VPPPPPDPVNDLEAEIRRLKAKRSVHRKQAEKERDNPTTPEPPTIETAADLQRKRFAPVKYVVPAYIVEGCTLLAGKPKAGKSWMTLDMALAVATGGSCLGVQAEKGDVLYLGLEDNERRLQNRISKIIGAFTKWPANFQYATAWPRENEGGLDRIREWAKSVANPRLVVVDVLAMFRSPRGNSQSVYESDYGAMKGLQALAGEFPGLAVIVVHHTRKGPSEDAFETVSGTLGVTGGADTILVLTKDGAGAVLHGKGRELEDIERAVEFDRATARWKVLGEAAEVRVSDGRAKILAALKSAESLGIDEAAMSCDLNYDQAKNLLFKMHKDGQIQKKGKGRYCALPSWQSGEEGYPPSTHVTPVTSHTKLN